MIVCSCTLITAKEVEEAVTALRTSDPFVVLTPGLIYRHLDRVGGPRIEASSLGGAGDELADGGQAVDTSGKRAGL